MTSVSMPTFSVATVNERLREVIDLHFDPRNGSAFWLERAAELGIDARREIQQIDELAILGAMTPADILARPLRHFVPRALHNQWQRLIVAQTGGTTGRGAWTAYFEEEFHEAFITPFEVAAKHTHFPREADWLYIGPSGPHIIGKVIRHIARSVGSADPFSVDFDPRWAKKLPPDSLAFSRYLDHVVQQALDVIQQQNIGVLFTTSAVLARLSCHMIEWQRQSIRGVHYGGMALSIDDLQQFQLNLFPNAVHLSGYGNTLLGCCMELHTNPGRPLDYFPYGNRIVFEVLDRSGESLSPGSTGQVCFTRLDKCMLIVRMRERDEAQLLPPPPHAPPGFFTCGVRDPHSPLAFAPNQRPGLY